MHMSIKTLEQNAVHKLPYLEGGIADASKIKGLAVISCEPFVCLVAGAGLEPTTFGL